MENSVSEAEANLTVRSPPRRRRSTFFEKRESFVPQPTPEVPENEHKRENDHINDKRIEELTRYYEKLVSEKDQWKREVKERRNKYHDLRQQFQIAVTSQSSSKMSYSALTNEDIEFLKGKPNLNKLVDNQQKLHKSLKQTIALVQRKNQLDEIILNYCEDRVSRIADHILENSTIEPIE